MVRIFGLFVCEWMSPYSVVYSEDDLAKYENFIAVCTDTLYIKTTCNKVTTDNT